jgi:hypothetical protein
VRVQTVHEYDNAEYPFTDFVCDALGVAPAELAKLHETPAGAAARLVQLLCNPVRPRLCAGKFAQQHPPRSGHDPFRRRFLTYVATNAAARARLDEIVARFVAKRLKAALGHRWEHFAYQSEPSLRVHLAGARTLGIR